MKISADALIAALLDQRFHLSGDEDGGVGLHCRPCFDGGRPLAYYERNGSTLSDPEVANVATIPALWATAVDHLATAHRAEARS